MKHKTRVLLIRFAKSFPFVICFIVLFSYSECLIALTTNNYAIYDGAIIPNTPMSWCIARNYEYGVYSIIAAIVLSVAMETCVWNKLAIVYLIVQLLEKHYFENIELYVETIYAIIVVNVAICCFFVWKGVKIVSSAFYNPR